MVTCVLKVSVMMSFNSPPRSVRFPSCGSERGGFGGHSEFHQSLPLLPRTGAGRQVGHGLLFIQSHFSCCKYRSSRKASKHGCLDDMCV